MKLLGTLLLLSIIGLPCGAQPLPPQPCPKVLDVVRVPTADRLGLEYSVTKVPIKGPKGQFDNFVLQFQFEPMTEVQFNQLKKELGNTSLAIYRRGHRYQLSDFLGPVLQALINKHFLGIENKEAWAETNFSDLGETVVRVETNCYGTLWELLRQQGIKSPSDKVKISAFWAGFSQAYALLKENSTLIGQNEMRPGDYALFVDDKGGDQKFLMHAAYFVDGEVYFEKTDLGSEFAYRFVSLESMRAKLERLKDGELKIEFRRPGNKPLLPPSQSLSIAFDPFYQHLAESVPEKDRANILLGDIYSPGGRPIQGLYRIREVEISVDARTGLGQISPGDPLANHFVPVQPAR